MDFLQDIRYAMFISFILMWLFGFALQGQIISYLQKSGPENPLRRIAPRFGDQSIYSSIAFIRFIFSGRFHEIEDRNFVRQCQIFRGVVCLMIFLSLIIAVTITGTPSKR